MDDIFWLSDARFARLEPLLPTDTRGVARADVRRVIGGIVHVLKSGGRWEAKRASRCADMALMPDTTQHLSLQVAERMQEARHDGRALGISVWAVQAAAAFLRRQPMKPRPPRLVRA